MQFKCQEKQRTTKPNEEKIIFQIKIEYEN